MSHTIVDIREEGGEIAAAALNDVDRLADALRVLHGASLPWTPAVVREVAALLDKLAGESQVQASAGEASVSLATRRVARDTRRVLSSAP